MLVDGRRAAKSTRLRGGERIAVEEEVAPDQPQVVPPPLPEVAWEDEHVLVVDKPPGLVVHPAPGHRGTDVGGDARRRTGRLMSSRARSIAWIATRRA